MPQFKFAEFFAGGGMARAGLGESWECVLANDIDAMKCATYRANWSASDLLECDIADLPPTALQKKLIFIGQVLLARTSAWPGLVAAWRAINPRCFFHG